jgi:DNA gyrase subunit A
MLITENGQLIRCPVRDIRIAGRNTQGVTIFRTANDEKVVSVAKIEIDEEKEDIEGVELIENTEAGENMAGDSDENEKEKE